MANLKEIFEQLKEWTDMHDYEEDFDDFNNLCNRIMKDNQTYFQWSVDNDTFSIIDAFASVMEFLANDSKQIKDYKIDYLDNDRLFLLIEYK